MGGCVAWIRSTIFWQWVWCTGQLDRPSKTAVEKLQMSIRVTAKCRYNAAARLEWQGKFAFFTTTSLSLGLVLIPLLQNSGVELRYSVSVLNMMSIFLAVSVLVYSVVIGTAKYEVRAENLTDCGNRLKELNRSLARDLIDCARESDVLEAYHTRYSDIVTDTENHSRDDYAFAMLEMRRDYLVTGIPRLKLWVASICQYLFRYFLPFFMIITEFVFISDMLGVTCVLTPFLVVAQFG